MKYYLFALIFISTTSLCGQTQQEMNSEAYESLKLVENQMSEILTQIFADYQDDGQFIQNMKLSQDIWMSLRSAELSVRFPDKGEGYYGSILPVCKANYLEELTKSRIEHLQAYLKGGQEGNACLGSLRVKE